MDSGGSPMSIDEGGGDGSRTGVPGELIGSAGSGDGNMHHDGGDNPCCGVTGELSESAGTGDGDKDVGTPCVSRYIR